MSAAAHMKSEVAGAGGPPTSGAAPVVELRGITKAFPGVVANDDITFDVRGGEVHCLLGENGAGKSTLMGILSGIQRPDSGRILVDGEEVDISSPRDALAYAFKTVHLQHGGKLSLTRLLAGHLDDGATLQSSSGETARASGISGVNCALDTKRASAEAGDTVALGKLETVRTGDTLSSGKTAPSALAKIEPTPTGGAFGARCTIMT